ncbi:MAG: Crp/Fnr family transcriptional regulator [Treponema sp.]|nr:Crp/Fnr family transcriptional regulator [Treponema sp.]
MEEKYKAVLKNAYLFQNISNKEYNTLIDCLSPQLKQFSKNETIFWIGDLIRHIGIILSGTAHANLEHINGNQTLISILSPMRVFGDILASTKTQQSPVTVCATSDVTAVFIEFNKICSMCATACTAHRVLLQNMLRYIGDKYFYTFDRINILREKSLRSKILAYLYALSSNGEVTTVKIPYSKTMLADYLLANRSAVSKELRKMELDGLITMNKREVELKLLINI